MTRIAYISKSVIPSRTANSVHVMQMASAYAELKHEVSLFAPDKFWQEEENIENPFEFYGIPQNFTLKKVPVSKGFGIELRYLWTMQCQLRRQKFELFHTRFLSAAVLASAKGKVIFEAHNRIWEDGLSAKLQFSNLLKHPNLKKVILISNVLKQDYCREFPMHCQKFHVHPDGARLSQNDIPVINLPEAKIKKPFAAGYFGHLYPGRGIDVLIETAKLAGNWNIFVFGGSENDLQFWRSQKLPDNLILAGYLAPADVAPLQAACDLLLAPYQRKVAVHGGAGNTVDFMSPLKIFEYMASGKSIVLSDLPVLHEVLGDESATFVECDNAKAWAEALKKNENSAFREAKAASAFRRLKEEYNWTERARRILI